MKLMACTFNLVWTCEPELVAAGVEEAMDRGAEACPLFVIGAWRQLQAERQDSSTLRQSPQKGVMDAEARPTPWLERKRSLGLLVGAWALLALTSPPKSIKGNPQRGTLHGYR